MEADSLRIADSERKNERAREGKRQGAVVDLLLALIVGAEEAKQEQNCGPCCQNSEGEDRNTKGRDLADCADRNCRNYRSAIEKPDRHFDGGRLDSLRIEQACGPPENS